jgi:hypothetical protein
VSSAREISFPCARKPRDIGYAVHRVFVPYENVSRVALLAGFQMSILFNQDGLNKYTIQLTCSAVPSTRISKLLSAWSCWDKVRLSAAASVGEFTTLTNLPSGNVRFERCIVTRLVSLLWRLNCRSVSMANNMELRMYSGMGRHLGEVRSWRTRNWTHSSQPKLGDESVE